MFHHPERTAWNVRPVNQPPSLINLNMSDLRTLKLIVPPFPLQREFAAFIEQLDKSQFEAQALIGKLDLLYRAKLQEYFG